jgi:cytochrome c-type biogenesis protein CcmE
VAIVEHVGVPDRVRGKLAIAVAVVVAAVALHARAPRGDPPYVMVDELVAGGLDLVDGARFRVHGLVRAGTIACTGFELVRRGARLRVVHRGPLPDALRDQSEVIVTGRIEHDDRGWYLDGTSVLAKCPGKYDGAPSRPRYE